MRKEGKPTLQALASVLSTHHKNTDMSDIHLLVKRRLAALHLGEKKNKNRKNKIKKTW